MTSEHDDQASALATLVFLGRRARETDSAAELRFLLVNETQALLPYRQAAFWTPSNGVEALSGVSSVERHTSYVQWLNHWFSQAPDSDKVRAFSSDLRLLSNDRNWAEWLPPQVVSLQLPPRGNFEGGRVLLARDEPFSPPELTLLEEWAAGWQDRYSHLVSPTLYRRLRITGKGKLRWVYRLGAVAITLALGALPVQLSVLAPAELIPLDPAVVRAPMDGIIEQIDVEPNQRVQAGDPLFRFDRVSLDSRLEIARHTLATAHAEYQQQAQRAVFDPDSKAKLAILKSRSEEKRTEVSYLEALAERSVVRSPREGLVLLNSESEWSGRPVVTGERVLIVANEKQAQVEAWLSPADMVQFPASTIVTLYLSADPLASISARVDYIAHQPELRPDGQYAHRLRATLSEPEHPNLRIGLKGTASIEGKRVSLIYWVLRRPWAALRGWLGI